MPSFNIHTDDVVWERYYKDQIYKEMMRAKMAEHKLQESLIAESQISKRIEQNIINALNTAPKETTQETVIRMLKGDFQKVVGVSFEDFIEAYHSLIENNPEKLI